MEYDSSILGANEEYVEQTKAYGGKDALLALALYTTVTFFYFILGSLIVQKRFARTLTEPYIFWASGIVSIVSMGLIALLCYLRKQKLTTLGLGKTQASKSLLMGVVLSAIIVVIAGVPDLASIKANAALIPVKLFYYLVFVAFLEELEFRAYVGTRIYGFCRHKWLSVFFVAFLFALEHIPMKLLEYQITFPQYILNNGGHLIFYAVFHIALQWLYSKHNSIIAPILVHFTWNFMTWFSKL